VHAPPNRRPCDNILHVSSGYPTLTDDQWADVRAKLASGVSVSELARQYETSRMTIQRACG
jgi:DNA invertase Pin-like site-specific DNA recombinase